MLRRHGIEPAVQFGSRDAFVPHAVGVDDVLHQLVKAIPGLAGNRRGADATCLRHQAIGLFAQIRQHCLRILNHVPFVEGENGSTAFA